jgi:metallo-beta-lactamase family protein
MGRWWTCAQKSKSWDSSPRHADYPEILRWLGNFKRTPKEVFIVHGEAESRRALREKISRELGWKVTLPEHLEKFDLK